MKHARNAYKPAHQIKPGDVWLHTIEYADDAFFRTLRAIEVEPLDESSAFVTVIVQDVHSKVRFRLQMHRRSLVMLAADEAV